MWSLLDSSLIVQVAHLSIAPIGCAYELSPADLLRRRRRRGIVHAGGACDRHRPAVALPAHPRARGRAERAPDRAAAARHRAHAGGPHAPPGGAGGGARGGTRPPRSTRGARPRGRRARDRDRPLDGRRPAAALHPGLARAVSRRRHPPAGVPAPFAARRRRRCRALPTSRSGRCRFEPGRARSM